MSKLRERHERQRRAAPATALLVAALMLFPLQPATAQTQAPTLTISTPQAITLDSPSQTPLAISVAPAASIPRNAFLRLRGLPPTAALSEGYAIGPGSWAVALTALPALKLIVPAAAEGRADLTVALVSVEGTVLAEARTSLVIGKVPAAVTGAPSSATILRAGPLQPPPPRAPAPTLAPQERERAMRLFKRGQEQLKDANVAEARLFFEKAADAGLSEAALALGATFEAAELEKLDIRGAWADDAQARRWYEKAAQLGAQEAQQRLQRLGRK